MEQHAMQQQMQQQQWNGQQPMHQMPQQWTAEMARQGQRQQIPVEQHVAYQRHSFGGEGHASCPPPPPSTSGGATYYGQNPHQNRRNTSKLASGRELESYFISQPLRQELVRRGQMLYHCLPQEMDPLEGIQVDRYVNLLELECQNRRLVDPTKVYQGLTGRVFRCIDSTNGQVYVLRKLEAFQPSGKLEMAPLERWKKVKHPSIVGMHQAFTSQAIEEASALYYTYTYHPGTVSLEQRIINGSARPTDASIWSIVCQLVCALRHLHLQGLACRVLSPSKILVGGRARVRINCCGILDVISPSQQDINVQYQEDLMSLGRLVLQLCCRNLAAASNENLQRSLETVDSQYGAEMKNLVWQLLSAGNSGKNVLDICALISGHLMSELETSHESYDELERETASEVENGRLARMLIKLSFVCQHPHFGQFESSEAPYLLKLTWDYIFHQSDEEGNPVVEYAHVVDCLNKLDIGVDEQVMLVSSDAADLLCVSWKDLKECLDKAAADLTAASCDSRNAYVEQPMPPQVDFIQQQIQQQMQQEMQQMQHHDPEQQEWQDY